MVGHQGGVVSTRRVPAGPRRLPPVRARLRHRLAVAGLSAAGLAMLGWTAITTSVPRLIYNPSDSVPVGWYRILPVSCCTDTLPVGSIVLTHLPTAAATFAAQRGYLPPHIPLLKRVGAVAPQQVCVTDRAVLVDGVPVAGVLPVDRLRRPLHGWAQCRRLQPGELFLLSATNPASFDSRYFGPITCQQLIGVAHPLHTGM